MDIRCHPKYMGIFFKCFTIKRQLNYLILHLKPSSSTSHYFLVRVNGLQPIWHHARWMLYEQQTFCMCVLCSYPIVNCNG